MSIPFLVVVTYARIQYLVYVPLPVGDCDKVGRGNGAKECPDGGTHNGMYDAVILEKGEKSRAVRSYADVTRGNV